MKAASWNKLSLAFIAVIVLFIIAMFLINVTDVVKIDSDIALGIFAAWMFLTLGSLKIWSDTADTEKKQKEATRRQAENLTDPFYLNL